MVSELLDLGLYFLLTGGQPAGNFAFAARRNSTHTLIPLPLIHRRYCLLRSCVFHPLVQLVGGQALSFCGYQSSLVAFQVSGYFGVVGWFFYSPGRLGFVMLAPSPFLGRAILITVASGSLV
mgnify:CR=1 FL=1